MSFSSTLAIAASGMRSQASRISHVSENIANTDTPGYRRKMVAFEPDRAAGAVPGAVTTGPVRLDRTALPQVYDPAIRWPTRPAITPGRMSTGHGNGRRARGAAQLRGQPENVRPGAPDVSVAARPAATR